MYIKPQLIDNMVFSAKLPGDGTQRLHTSQSPQFTDLMNQRHRNPNNNNNNNNIMVPSRGNPSNFPIKPYNHSIPTSYQNLVPAQNEIKFMSSPNSQQNLNQIRQHSPVRTSVIPPVAINSSNLSIVHNTTNSNIAGNLTQVSANTVNSPIQRLNDQMKRSDSYDSPAKSNVLYQKTEWFLYPNTDRYLEKETIQEIIPHDPNEMQILNDQSITNNNTEDNDQKDLQKLDYNGKKEKPADNIFEEIQNYNPNLKTDRPHFKLSTDMSDSDVEHYKNQTDRRYNFNNPHQSVDFDSNTNNNSKEKQKQSQSENTDEKERMDEKNEEIKNLKDLLLERQKENDQLKIKVQMLENEKTKSQNLQKHIRTLEQMLLEKHSQINEVRASNISQFDINEQLKASHQLIERLEKQQNQHEVKLMMIPVYQQEIQGLKTEQQELIKALDQLYNKGGNNSSRNSVPNDQTFVSKQDHQSRVSILADQIGRLNKVVSDMKKERDENKANGLSSESASKNSTRVSNQGGDSKTNNNNNNNNINHLINQNLYHNNQKPMSNYSNNLNQDSNNNHGNFESFNSQNSGIINSNFFKLDTQPQNFSNYNNNNSSNNNYHNNNNNSNINNNNQHHHGHSNSSGNQLIGGGGHFQNTNHSNKKDRQKPQSSLQLEKNFNFL